VPFDPADGFDVSHGLEHPDVAGYVLGALDPDDARAFAGHLEACAECQAIVAEFAPVAKALDQAAPAAEPPAHLEAATVARVERALLTARETPAGRRAARWRRARASGRLVPAVSAAVGAAVATAGFLIAQLFQSGPAVAATFALNAQPGGAGSATAVARIVPGGYQIHLDVHGLPGLAPGQFFECVYVGSGGQLVSGGTFSASDGTVTMQSAANPRDFHVIQIRQEQPGTSVAAAPVILSGTASVP
jgi:anti-sigma-K factor RskA